MRPLFPALAGLLVLIGSVPLLSAELGAVLGAGHSQATRMEAMLDGRPRAGWSTDSHKRVMDQCNMTLTNPAIGQQGPEVRQAILDHCEDQALRALDRAPADAHTWWARAVFAAERGDFDTTFDALRQSRDYGPYELWIALRREAIDRRLAIFQDDVQRGSHDKDLVTLAYSRRGVEELAQRYASYPDFRERVVELVEELPATYQRRFLWNVRDAMVALREVDPLTGLEDADDG